MTTGKKAKKQSYQLLRGMRDALPDEERYWIFVTDRVLSLARRYGFHRIDTPVIESASLFERSTGESSDIVMKEMYVFTDASGERIALRPEGTPGVARAYIEHGMLNQAQPMKLFYIEPMFRHDRPQAGRYRQHVQFGFEVIGDEHPIIDAQLIQMSYELYHSLNIPVSIEVNSIGSKASRSAYIKKLTAYLDEHKKVLGPDDQKRLKMNPLRILDTKDKPVQEILADAPQIVDFLNDEDKEHFIQVLEYLDEMETPYNLNPRIVRGLDYYSRTTWEIIDSSKGEGQDSLGGGGRYDELLHTMGARSKTPAVGFACGVERLITKLRSYDIAVPNLPKPDIYIAQLGKEAKKKALKLFQQLNAEGFVVGENFSKDGLKQQLEQADKLGVSYSLIIGQQEILDNTVLIRDMENGNQETVDSSKIVNEVKKHLEKRVENKRIERKNPEI